MTDELVFTFNDTRSAIVAERALSSAGLNPRTMPLPPSIRAGCGLCARIGTGALDAALEALGGAYDKIFLRRTCGISSTYEELKPT